jgi:hypothetical protein
MKAPAYWGQWFVPLGEGEVKQTNLNIFLQLGKQLEYFTQTVRAGVDMGEVLLYSVLARDWLARFISETAELDDQLKDSRGSARGLLDQLNAIHVPNVDWNRKFTQDEYNNFSNAREAFENNFERERHNIDVFIVLPKGIYSTRLLIEKPENKFPEDVRSVFSDIVLYDLAQAGRCLAFDIPTAVAFHVFRATQAVMHDYYEAVSKQKWTDSRHEWGRYAGEIEKLADADKDVVMRLKEIGRFERNPTFHEDVIVSLNKAPILFELCSGVIYTMAEEIRKINAAP